MALTVGVVQRAARPRLGTDGDDETIGRGVSRRSIRARLGVPSGRAALGGLLVVMSGLGLLLAHQSASGPEPRQWIVVRRPIPPGVAITADDVAFAAMDLHPDTAARAFARSDEVIGQIAIGPLERGDLVSRSDLAAESSGPNASRRIGVELEPAAALNGELAVGERIDVVASGSDAPSRVIARGALVAGISGRGSDSVGSSERIRLTLIVADEEQAKLVIESSTAGSITLMGASELDLGGGGSDRRGG